MNQCSAYTRNIVHNKQNTLHYVDLNPVSDISILQWCTTLLLQTVEKGRTINMGTGNITESLVKKN